MGDCCSGAVWQQEPQRRSVQGGEDVVEVPVKGKGPPPQAHDARAVGKNQPPAGEAWEVWEAHSGGEQTAGRRTR